MLRANKASCCETFPTVRASERDNTDHPTLSVYFKYDNNISVNANVVVQFYPWFSFYFPLFFRMEMYDNENKTKENKNRHWPCIQCTYVYVVYCIFLFLQLPAELH